MFPWRNLVISLCFVVQSEQQWLGPGRRHRHVRNWETIRTSPCRVPNSKVQVNPSKSDKELSNFCCFCMFWHALQELYTALLALHGFTTFVLPWLEALWKLKQERSRELTFHHQRRDSVQLAAPMPPWHQFRAKVYVIWALKSQSCRYL